MGKVDGLPCVAVFMARVPSRDTKCYGSHGFCYCFRSSLRCSGTRRYCFAKQVTQAERFGFQVTVVQLEPWPPSRVGGVQQRAVGRVAVTVMTVALAHWSQRDRRLAWELGTVLDPACCRSAAWQTAELEKAHGTVVIVLRTRPAGASDATRS